VLTYIAIGGGDGGWLKKGKKWLKIHKISFKKIFNNFTPLKACYEA